MVVRLYKGQDTRFANLRQIVFTLITDLDLTGYTGCFRFLDNEKCIESAQIAAKAFTLEYSYDEIKQFPLGQNYGWLYLTDSDGRKAEVIKVIVDVVINPCVTGIGNQVKVDVSNVFADYGKCGNKPKINGVTIVGDKSASDYDIHSIPAGGRRGEVLAKESDNGYDVGWHEIGDIAHDGNAVHYDSEDNKTEPQKAQARKNMGAITVYREASGKMVFTMDAIPV